MADDFNWADTELLSLSVDTTDMVGQQLDTNPATMADWQTGHWQHYENTSGDTSTDLGGIDQSMRLIDDGRVLYSSTTSTAANDTNNANTRATRK